jgi:hypothetical protein
MAENKMQHIAALFGKKLGERFTLQFCEYRFDCLFTENGLAYAQPITREFDDELFVQMIKGEAVIVDD